MTASEVPAISVVMAVRNGARYLDLALNSLARQTFPNFEILVVENGSNDDTADILAAWEAREPRLRVFQLPHPQIARSLNFAAAQARAPLLARLDADDIAYPERLAVQHRAMAERQSIGVLGAFAQVIDMRGRRLGSLRYPTGPSELRATLRRSCPLIHSTVMLRAELFRSVGGYRPGLNNSEDYDLWARLAGICDLANLPVPLVDYRIHRESITSRHPARMALASFCITAAQEARRRGLPEPFIGGVPNLRRAQAPLDLSHDRSRKLVRLMALRCAFSRRWFTLPLPPLLKTGIHKIGTKLRLRPVYLAILRLATGLRGDTGAAEPSAGREAIATAPSRVRA